MLPLFGLLLLESGLTNLVMRAANGTNPPAVIQILLVLLTVSFSVGMLAVGLVTVFAMVQRFRNSLLRDEGYIMHTLPVSIHAHIWAKVIVSGLWYALSSAAFVLASLLVAADAEFVGELLRSLSFESAEMLAELLGIFVLANIFLSLLIYASLAVGHSLPTRKMLWSVLTFLALVFLTSLISRGLSALAASLVDGITDIIYDGFAAMTAWRAVCAVGACYLILFSAVYYLVTVWFMKRRLNLE